jgi:hypothetical protein
MKNKPEKIKLLNSYTGNYDEHEVSPLKVHRTSTHDHNLLCFEAYNHDDDEIYFMKIQGKGYDGPDMIVCKGKDFAFIPHSYYIVSSRLGKPVTITKNFGKNKFIGNKLPSRPE